MFMWSFGPRDMAVGSSESPWLRFNPYSKRGLGEPPIFWTNLLQIDVDNCQGPYLDPPCTSIKGLMVTLLDGIWDVLKGSLGGAGIVGFQWLRLETGAFRRT